MSRKYTQEDFLRRAVEIHGDRLDFSEFEYNGNSKKGKCKCSVCGHEWYVVPMSLFKGHGCPKCAVTLKAKKLSFTTEEIIDKFREIHGEKYCYDKVDYKNYRSEVEIICPIHGEFFQKPELHLRGHGCPKCSKGGIKLEQEDFVNRMHIRFKDIDFGGFNYINSHERGLCRCKNCGFEWETNAVSLSNSIYGCPKCATKYRSLKRSDTLEDFLEKYQTRYPINKYDFSCANYRNALTKMDVICEQHGLFKMTPNDLLNGHGCPRCCQSQLERITDTMLNENKFEYISQARFEWLGGLSLDFYLPSMKVGIECQGEQHFVPVDHFGGEEKLAKQREHDELKRRLCKENGVQLVYLLDEKYNTFMDGRNIYFNDVADLSANLLERSYLSE